MITINVVSTINSPFCVSTEDADIIYNMLKDNLQAHKACISFKDYKLLTPLFFNLAIGRLYGIFEYDYVDQQIEIVDLSGDDVRLVPILIRRAKRYFKDPEYYDRIIEKCMEEW